MKRGLEGVHLTVSELLNRLLYAIKAIYHAPNPYHNYVHAIDVLQATYTFLMDLGLVPPFSHLREPTKAIRSRIKPDDSALPAKGLGTRRAREVMRSQDVLGIMIAAMGHDVGHPGLSNAFMKNAKTPLSQVYDDKSVLENMHCMLVIQLLKQHGLGFVVCENEARRSVDNPARRAFDARGFRRVLYSSVLATDMSLHFAWVSSLKSLSERMSDAGAEDANCQRMGSPDLDHADKILICQALIKCADISNPVSLPHRVYVSPDQEVRPAQSMFPNIGPRSSWKSGPSRLRSSRIWTCPSRLLPRPTPLCKPRGRLASSTFSRSHCSERSLLSCRSWRSTPSGVQTIARCGSAGWTTCLSARPR